MIRELWPTLPEPMTPLKGELADKWLRLELSAKSRPTCLRPNRVAYDRRGVGSSVRRSLAGLPECDRFEENAEHRQRTRAVLQTIVGALPPQLDGNRVVMQFPTDTSQLDKLRGLMSETAATWRWKNRVIPSE